jgi:hypothetical protein
MLAIIGALLPIFILIMLGVIFKRIAFPGDAFWPLAARITYFVFFPCLLATRLASADLGSLDLGALALVVVLPILLVALAMVLARPLLRVSNRSFTSLFQGSFRINTYVGLAGAGAVLGDTGLELAALALALIIPLVNVLSVAALTHYIAQVPLSPRATLIAILKTPPVVGCLVGLAFNVLGLGLPPLIGEVMLICSRAALPVGLITVGSALSLATVRLAGLPVLLVSLLKLCVVPLLTALLCTLFGVTGEARIIALLFASLPGAPAAYLLAQELGGDVELMSAILSVQIVLAALTMPLMSVLW